MPNNRSKIKLSESGRSATFLNPLRGKGLVAIKVDGCVITSGVRADFAVEQGRKVVIVELKGRDVESAAKQVSATTAHWFNSLKRCDEVAGLIIATQYPRASSTIQLKQQEFRKKFRAPLHVVCQNVEFEFDRLFHFRNPLAK